MRIAIVLTCWLLGLLAQSASAQTEAPPSPPPAAASDAGKLDFVELAAFLDRQRELVEEYQRVTAETLDNIESAEARFDAMIASYENLVKAVGSESEVAAQIDRFAALYQGYAEEAGASEDPERRANSDKFRALSREAVSMKADFVREAALAVTQIAELEQQKSLAVDHYRLQQGGLVIAALRGQLDGLTSANVRVRGAIDEARTSGVPIETGPAVQ